MYKYIYYANELDINCTMNVNNKTTYNYLKIEIAGKTGGIWHINITNQTNMDLVVEYNTKMCNLGDAENWVNLLDVVKVPVNEGQTVQVDISENWFATSIAVSYKYGSRRLITYADGLNTNGGMNVKYK